MRVNRGQRQMAVHILQLVAQLLLELLDGVIDRATVRAFIVAILDQGNRCIGRTLTVIAVADRQR
jgi:hypothetical protein